MIINKKEQFMLEYPQKALASPGHWEFLESGLEGSTVEIWRPHQP